MAREEIKFPEGLDIRTAEGQQQLVKIALLHQLDISEDQIVPEANLKDDLEADSLDAVELIQVIEEGASHYGVEIEIKDDRASALKTVGDVYSALDELISAA